MSTGHHQLPILHILAEEIGQRDAKRVLRLGRSSRGVRGSVAVVTAGSSDQPVAEEAVVTLDFFEVSTVRAYDCGVAGRQHR